MVSFMHPLVKFLLMLKKISENANELIQTIIKLKPSAAKGSYLKSIYMSSTMGLGIEIDTNL